MNGELDGAVDWRGAYLELEKQMEQVIVGAARAADAARASVARLSTATVREVDLTARGDLLACVVVADGRDLEYTFTLFRDGAQVGETGFGRSNTTVFTVDGPGTYVAQASVRSREEPQTVAEQLSRPVVWSTSS